MIGRPFWTQRLLTAWEQAPIVWLTGARRAGKTVLAHSLPDAAFLNCDLPSVAERLRDPESFYQSLTGMVCHARGWDQLRPEDCGVLWEHLVLDTLIAAGLPKVHFWRDKQQREVDFVVPRQRDTVHAIECKWKPQALETRGLAAFREHYPKGKNFVVSPLPGPAYERVQDGLKILIASPGELRLALAKSSST